MNKTLQTFKCPTCGSDRNVELDLGEEREIACGACYWEEWIAGKPIEESKQYDADKGCDVYTEYEPTMKVEHGCKFKVTGA